MKFKVIIGRNVSDFEKKINNFLEKSIIIDIKYYYKDFMAFILYEDISDKIVPQNNIGWTAPFFEEAAKILNNNNYKPV